MKELKDAIAKAFDNVVASGAIELSIEKKLTSTIIESINDQLSIYSEFGKSVKAKVSEAIQVNLDEMDLPSYSDLVGKIIRRQVEASMQSTFATEFEKNVADLLVPAPAEITLEQLLEQFIEHNKDYCGDGRMHGQPFTLLIADESGGYRTVSLDMEPNQKRHQCAIQIGIKEDGSVWRLELGGRDLKEKLFVGPLFNFEKSLFQMHTARTKLIVPAGADPYDYETRFPYPSGHDD